MWLWDFASGIARYLIGIIFLALGLIMTEFTVISISAIAVGEQKFYWWVLLLLVPVIGIIAWGIYWITSGNKKLDSIGKISKKEFRRAVNYLKSRGYTADQIIRLATKRS